MMYSQYNPYSRASNMIDNVITTKNLYDNLDFEAFDKGYSNKNLKTFLGDNSGTLLTGAAGYLDSYANNLYNKRTDRANQQTQRRFDNQYGYTPIAYDTQAYNSGLDDFYKKYEAGGSTDLWSYSWGEAKNPNEGKDFEVGQLRDMVKLSDDFMEPLIDPSEYMIEEIPPKKVEQMDYSIGAPVEVDNPAYTKHKTTYDFMNEIASQESNGNIKADNPNSSAFGKYQFLKSWNPQIHEFVKARTEQESFDIYANDENIQDDFMFSVIQNQYLPQARTLKNKASRYNLSEYDLIKLLHFKGYEGTKELLTSGEFDKVPTKEQGTKNPTPRDYINNRQ